MVALGDAGAERSSTRRLHVGGLSPDVLETDVAQLFAPFGKVRTVEVNMALCSLAVGDVSAAVAAAAGIVAPASDAGEQLLSSLCHGVLAIGAARAAEWSAADAHLAAFLEPQQRGLVDGEHAQLAEGFAREARHHGEVWRADVAARAAREIWLGLGRLDRLDDG